jgi:hypothetical protein
MASEADSSLPENTPSSIKSSSTRQAQLRSPVHEFTRPPYENEPIYDEKNRRLIYCNQCESYSALSTTNIKKHLAKDHAISIDLKQPYTRTKEQALEKLQELWAQTALEFGTDEVDSIILTKVLNKEVIQQALINFIIVQNLPFRVVERKEFHVFCQALNPKSSDLITTTHTEISRMITHSFQLQKDIVRRRVQSALTSIHLSIDIWTSPNNHLLLAVCAHFINSQENQIKALLALRTVPGHSGAEQWNTLLPVLEEYGIIRKLGAIIADNSTTNDTLCRTIHKYLADNEDITWDPIQQRIRCQGHTINLAVQAFLFKDTLKLKAIESYERDNVSGKEQSYKEETE